MKKLRVMQFGRFDNQQHAGGLQAYVQSLMSTMHDSVQCDNFVASTDRTSWVRQEGDNRVIASASYGLFASVPLSPGLLFNALREWRKQKYDLIHLHFPDPLSMIVAWFLPKSVPVVVTWHSDVVRQKTALRFYLPLLKRFLKRVKAVVVATPAHITSCEQLGLYGHPENIHVIPFGVDQDRLKVPQAREADVAKMRNEIGERKFLFALGRHVYYKGYTYLLSAMKDVNNATLFLGGGGPLTKDLQAQAEQEGLLPDKVRFCGYVAEDDLSVYLNACDAFCFPSVEPSEAYGFAQIEAMLCGKPVICCELHNGVNYVNRTDVTGLTVEPRDVKALSKAIQKLVDDTELRQKLGRQAKERAMKEFTLKAMADQMKNLYSSLV